MDIENTSFLSEMSRLITESPFKEKCQKLKINPHIAKETKKHEFSEFITCARVGFEYSQPQPGIDLTTIFFTADE